MFFTDIEKIKEKSNEKLPFHRHLIITQNLKKLEIKPCLNVSIFKKLLLFTQLRIKVNKLEMEVKVGRYRNHNVPRDESYCINFKILYCC